jgi:cell division protein FtsQ
MVAIFSLIAFESREYKDEICHDVIVKVNNQYDNYFIDEHDVLNMMTNDGQDVLIGKTFSAIALKTIESRIKNEAYIKKGDVFKDLKGNLMVNVNLRRPVARVVSEKGIDQYIAEDGVFLPISRKFTSRVVLVSGMNTEDHKSIIDLNPDVFEMINFINEDSFWKAQIAQIDITKNGELILYPQVTKQYVEFGTVENMKTKFKRLKVFYKNILPQQGWNKYNRINLKYKDQIIAE